MSEPLSLRLTRTYVGQWDYLDRWREIGLVTLTMGEPQHTNEEDVSDPTTVEGFAEVQTYAPEHPRRIEEALTHTYSKSGCDHEYDCCGCRSFTASAEHVGQNVYRLTICSSQNY